MERRNQKIRMAQKGTEETKGSKGEPVGLRGPAFRLFFVSFVSFCFSRVPKTLVIACRRRGGNHERHESHEWHGKLDPQIAQISQMVIDVSSFTKENLAQRREVPQSRTRDERSEIRDETKTLHPGYNITCRS